MTRLVCGTLALGIFGVAVVVCQAAAHRDPPALAAAAVQAPAAGIDLGRIAGRWRAADASLLIVTAKGEVWSDRGAMQGRARPAAPGANFAFGDGAFLCAYALAFAADGTADWRLVDHTPQTPCPQGRLTRAAAL